MFRNYLRAAVLVTAVGAPVTQAFAQTVSALFSFDKKDGSVPAGSLVADKVGNLYGTTTNLSSKTPGGTVFELTPPSAGQVPWTQTILFSFHGKNGMEPGGGVIFDSAGNLYGTAEDGGAHGDGEVFKLAPPAAGQTAWTETVIYSFEASTGEFPFGGLVADSAGNLYGTTHGGGAYGYGTIFKLAPPAAGKTAWKETVLLSFNGANGELPRGNLIFDSAGNLYGTANGGGANGYGTVVELTPPTRRQKTWTTTVPTSFDQVDGANPDGGLLFDSAGNLYGTTSGGGADGHGAVFELSPPAAGQTAWTDTVLFSFNQTDGSIPEGGLTADDAGNLYGTTWDGGGPNAAGVVFELTPPAAGQTAWTETTLASMNALADGGNPCCTLLADGAGNLYGIANYGGYYGYGAVFKVTP